MIIQSKEKLRLLRFWWDQQARETAIPFSQSAWIEQYINHLIEPDQEWLLAAYETVFGIEALFPLLVSGRELSFIGSEICDFQDVLSPSAGRLNRAVSELFHWASENGFYLRFHKLHSEGRIYRAITDNEFPGFCVDDRDRGPCPYLDLLHEGDLQKITGNFSKSTRKQVRRRLRILREECDVQLNCTVDFDPDLMRQIAEIHQQRHGSDSLFVRPGVSDFLQNVMEQQPGLLLCYTLESEQHGLMGFEIGLRNFDTYFSWLGGYREEHHNYRVGTCLMALIMEDQGQRGARIYDFLNGAELYKFHFNNGEYRIRQVTVKKDSVISRFTLAIEKQSRKWGREARALLVKLGLHRSGYRIDTSPEKT